MIQQITQENVRKIISTLYDGEKITMDTLDSSITGYVTKIMQRRLAVRISKTEWHKEGGVMGLIPQKRPGEDHNLLDYETLERSQ